MLNQNDYFRLLRLVPYQGKGCVASIKIALNELESANEKKLLEEYKLALTSFSTIKLTTALKLSKKIRINAESSTNLISEFITNIPILLKHSAPDLIPTINFILFKKLANEEQSALLLQWLGDSLHYFKSYTYAEKIYLRLMVWGSKYRAVPYIAHAHRGSGDCLLKRGNTLAAKKHYQQAKFLYSQLNKSDSMARVERNLGDCERASGNLLLADCYYQNAFSLSLDAGNKWHYCKALQESGWNEWLLGNLSTAMDSFQKAKEGYIKINRVRGQFSCNYAIKRLILGSEINRSILRPSFDEITLSKILGHAPWQEKIDLLSL